MTLKPATVVRAKSSDVEMVTISETNEAGEIWCEFRKADGQATAEWLPVDDLEVLRAA